MKVQGNAGPEVDRAVKQDLVNMRTIHMEYDCCSRKGRLPACFSRVFGLEVAPFVMIHRFMSLLCKTSGLAVARHPWPGSITMTTTSVSFLAEISDGTIP